MALTPFKVFILMCGFCSRFHAIEYPPIQTAKKEVQHGSDVSLRCDVSFLSESSTLQWKRDGEQTSNTTLLYNNSAYIILHTVDEHSEGKYYCRLMEDERVEIVRIYTLNVSSYSYNGKSKMNTIYRQSSNNSDVSLICKTGSTKKYSWKWTWEPRPNSQIDLIATEKGREVQVKGPIQPGRLSSTTYNIQGFIFHISPVNFNYSGIYRCITNTGIYTTTILHTIRVSGVLRSQSVILTCEVSEVTDSVTLVWLRMEGNRGVLGKQQIMTKKNKKLQLTVNLSSNVTDLLHWQCAVFTENTLRALAPITSLSTSTVTNPVINKQAIVSSVLPLFAGILLGALLYYFYRKRMSVRSDPQDSEPVYINISQMKNDRERSSTLGNREKGPEMYNHVRYEKTNINKRDETPVTSDSVTYTAIYFKKSRFQT